MTMTDNVNLMLRSINGGVGCNMGKEVFGKMVTTKEEGIKMVVFLMNKFDITPQDFVNEVNENRRLRKEATNAEVDSKMAG